MDAVMVSPSHQRNYGRTFYIIKLNMKTGTQREEREERERRVRREEKESVRPSRTHQLQI
jgi:hypothetical protein